MPSGGPDEFHECDDVLVAIGQENAFPWIEKDAGIEFDKWGLPQLNEKTFASTHPKVFFGSDAAFGPKNIIWAAAHGHEAATRVLDRGKVMTAEDLEAGKTFGRYLDVDGDGIPFRTYPGTHPTKGSYFTRGTTKDEFARYSEEGPVYVRNMERLQKKWETAKKIAPQPLRYSSPKPTRFGVIYFGSTSPAMDEALDHLEAEGHHVNALRVRSFPFAQSVEDFIHEHDRVFIVEQNRDAQLRTMLLSEYTLDSRKIVPVLHYDGTPITARFIATDIATKLGQFKVVSFDKAAS